MNPAYRRVVSPAVAAMMKRWEIVILGAWCAVIGGIYTGVLPMRAIALWFGVYVVVCFVNTLRVLGAHRYESLGASTDRRGQLVDSIDTPGGPWTTIWAPVGLRYHALHHYFPGIPYHSLGAAYRRIVSASAGSVYQQFSSPSLRHSLIALCLAPAAKMHGGDPLAKSETLGRSIG
jgi:fatty acid desaturase